MRQNNLLGSPTPDVFDWRVVAALRFFGWLAAGVSLLLGVVVLFGWLDARQALVTIRPNLAAMSPLTASCFLLAGLALACHKLGQPRIARAAAIVLGGASLAVLGGYALAGRDLVNPQLGNSLLAGGRLIRGSTAPATASAFLLLAISLLCLDDPRPPAGRLGIWVAGLGMLLSGLALLGYAYGVQGLYAVAFYRSMALHTALGLFVLFCASALHDPERDWAGIIASGLPSGRATRMQLLLASLVPFLTGLAVLRTPAISPTLGMAILVASTMVPLILRILLDGRTLDRLETERRLAVEAQLDLTRELEARVHERTARLQASEERLRQSQKMEAVGQLTGGLAHDFNNLLTGISGSLDLLEKRLAQGRAHEAGRYIETARAASQRASALTHRLLSFSRRQTLDPRPTDINQLLGGLDELLRRTVGPAIAVELALQGGLWPARLDANQLENALLNLCLNARDAMPDGGRLVLSTANRSLDEAEAADKDLPPGDYVSVAVHDTGTGMPPDVVARAFDPFFTTKPTGLGTGLGLSMVYGFARQSGGQVQIASTPGQGARISLYLPRHCGAIPDDAPAAPEPAVPATARRSILVVDDEPAIRMLVTDLLEEAGYHITEAETGAAGLAILQGPATIDLLVSDVGLPGGMNGRQLADAARMLRPKLRVLFITGYAEQAAFDRGPLEPDMHVLKKPFALDTLLHQVASMLAA